MQIQLFFGKENGFLIPEFTSETANYCKYHVKKQQKIRVGIYAPINIINNDSFLN